ncbi:MAG: hypothetical protein MUC63_03010 [Planctomycetes bacterium]|jgi:hypothetical protein|nr:hypothetical protein [Planctomycetota bacterium]MCU0727726.1 hypothetical protein [Planctomycetota bacterium]
MRRRPVVFATLSALLALAGVIAILARTRDIVRSPPSRPAPEDETAGQLAPAPRGHDAPALPEGVPPSGPPRGPGDAWEGARETEARIAAGRIGCGVANTRSSDEEEEEETLKSPGPPPPAFDPNPHATRWRETIDSALDWLARHQEAEGYWDMNGYRRAEGEAAVRDDGRDPDLDPATTGLAVLACLGGGHTHRFGPHRKTVREGLRWLKQVQNPDGAFGPRDTPSADLNLAVATLAMVEGFRRSDSPLFKTSARRALATLVTEDRPSSSAEAGWTALALDAARKAGLSADPPIPAPLEQLLVDRVDALPPDRRLVLAAARVLARLATGESPAESGPVRAPLDLVVEFPPRFEVFPDPQYWCLGALALARGRPEALGAWREGFLDAARTRQRTAPPDLAGSFDPLGFTGPEAGRAATTALIVLALQSMGHPPLRVLQAK